MKISTKEINLILVLLAVIVFSVAYFVLVNGYEEDSALVQAEIAELDPKLTEYEGHYAKMEEYNKSIEDTQEYIEDRMEHYPTLIQTEDYLMWMLDWRNENEATMPTVSFSPAAEITTFDLAFVDGGEEKLEPVTAWELGASTSAELSYANLKNAIDYINNEPMHTKLNAVTISYNIENENLATTFDLSKFYMNWFGSDYVPTALEDTELGLPQPFDVE